MGKRCFYTTPLKALSNQKFYDFRQAYGEDNVGLLTGDTSINRDASIVVMTTEVFRNMLYGTILGDLKRNIQGVSHVILDECHYMNDRERGTVWEESIIYCPTDIQIVALSATIANADELTTWIDETHGPTELVVSDFRPVPLRFHYFGLRHLYPLLSPGHGVNAQLKGKFGKKHKFQKERRGRPPQSLLPAPSDILATLAGRNMLPAIFFLFSRRGCEESMRRARGIPLLHLDEEKELRTQINEFIKDNPNLQNHPHLPDLYEGLSVHHAGMLPSWKMMVERLFQKGLLKVVFATETLAAGINMPARTTIISSISKRDDFGHRNLYASEFLQMSGRAGRRGMDEVGHVVVLSHPFESVEDAAKLATAKADPLQSQFTPSYGMVLNLLERHTIDEAKDLIEHSFGQFLINQVVAPLYEQRLEYEGEIERLSKPLCPAELGDLALYRKRLDGVHALQKQYKHAEKGLKTHDASEEEVNESLHGARQQIKDLLKQANDMPCHGCPEQKPCSKQTDRLRSLKSKVNNMTKRIDHETSKYWKTFQSLCDILRLTGYLDGYKPTKLGKMAAGIRGTNELFLSEIISDKCLDDLSLPSLAAVLTAMISEEAKGGAEHPRIKTSPEVVMVLERISRVAHSLHRQQRDLEIEIPVEFNTHFCGLTEMWANGASWDMMRQAAFVDEGDVVRMLRRTVDLARQYIRAPGVPDNIVHACMEVERLIARDEVKEDF
jgi:superfamily II RNA helicase